MSNQSMIFQIFGYTIKLLYRLTGPTTKTKSSFNWDQNDLEIYILPTNIHIFFYFFFYEHQPIYIQSYKH